MCVVLDDNFLEGGFNIWTRTNKQETVSGWLCVVDPPTHTSIFLVNNTFKKFLTVVWLEVGRDRDHGSASFCGSGDERRAASACRNGRIVAHTTHRWKTIHCWLCWHTNISRFAFDDHRRWWKESKIGSQASYRSTPELFVHWIARD